MNMKILDQLVAASIIDPITMKSWENGAFETVLMESGFEENLKSQLISIRSNDFKNFVSDAYSLIIAYDEPAPRLILPSALSGMAQIKEGMPKEAVA